MIREGYVFVIEAVHSENTAVLIKSFSTRTLLITHPLQHSLRKTMTR